MAPIPLLSLRTSSLEARRSLRNVQNRLFASTKSPIQAPNSSFSSSASHSPPQHHQRLEARQNGATTDGQVGTIIPTTYGSQGTLTPGAVAGIVLGVVFGILAFIIIVAWAMRANSGIDPSVEERIEVRETGVPARRSSGRRRRSRRSSRGSVYDVADVRVVRDVSPRRSGSRRSPRRSTTRVVEERVVTVPDEVYVERRPSRRRRSGLEEVVVEESITSSEPRKKRKSKRKSGGYR